MANSEKRQTFKLAENADYMRNIQVSMTTDASGENLRITFRNYEQAYDNTTGSQNQVRDGLEKVIEARLKKKGIAFQHRESDGYIVMNTQDPKAKGSQALYSEAEAAIKTIRAYTNKGVELKAALSQALVAEQSTDAGAAGPADAEVKTTLGREEAAAAIIKGVELVMPKAEAAKLAASLSATISKSFPTRPSVPPAPAGSDGAPLHDPLYKAVHDAVTDTVIADKGKRHYAVGEITDALVAAYDNLGKEQAAPMRKRA